MSNFPIGLSFFTFQGKAYYFDSERNGQKETTFDIFTFLTFFPQLLAGPIVPIKSFREGISNTNITYEDTLYGVHRFSVSLIKSF